MLTEVMPIKKKSILPDNSFLHMLYILQHFKGALSGLRQFLVTEIPSRMMTSAFYFTLKALFIFFPNNGFFAIGKIWLFDKN